MATREDPSADLPEPEPHGSLLQDLVRRAVNTSINTMLTTEEGVRAVVGAVAQKDLLNSAVAGVDATRREAVAIIAREIHAFLENLNVGEELAKILTSVSFEIRTEVRFVPNEDGTLRAKVKGSAGAKMPEKGVEASGEEEEPVRPTRSSTRRAVRSLVERLAEATAATARAAAEIAAEAAADVVNESRREPAREPEVEQDPAGRDDD